MSTTPYSELNTNENASDIFDGDSRIKDENESVSNYDAFNRRDHESASESSNGRHIVWARA